MSHAVGSVEWRVAEALRAWEPVAGRMDGSQPRDAASARALLLMPPGLRLLLAGEDAGPGFHLGRLGDRWSLMGRSPYVGGSPWEWLGARGDAEEDWDDHDRPHPAWLPASEMEVLRVAALLEGAAWSRMTAGYGEWPRCYAALGTGRAACPGLTPMGAALTRLLRAWRHRAR